MQNATQKIWIGLLILWTLCLASTVHGQMSEMVKLVASDAETDDEFGWSVAISGDRAIVGALQEQTNGFESGAAYVFERDGSGRWTEVAKLLASSGEDSVSFGRSVAISGDRAVVGAKAWATWIEGKAHVFERDGSGVWGEVAVLRKLNLQDSDGFGRAVSISGDIAVVGDGYEAAAFVFERDETGEWMQVARLEPSDKGFDWSWFGESISISGDRVIVGAERAAYVFERLATGVWLEDTKLQSKDLEDPDYFGTAVAISGERCIVGAHGKNGEAGAAYVFERDAAGHWIEVAKLVASRRQPEDVFGYSVSISGDLAIAGTPLSEGATGSAYLFQRDVTGAWKEVGRLSASDGEAEDEFGFSVAVSSGRVIVGAALEDAGGANSGAAYIFESLIVDVEETQAEVPAEFTLANYPNPFNPSTRITYDLPHSADVTVAVYDLLGRRVDTLASGIHAAGRHEVIFDAGGLPSGPYLARLEGDFGMLSRQMMLVR